MNYYGITYSWFLSYGLILRFWRHYFCCRGIHLFDECSSWKHYLVCDACQFMVHIERFEDTYAINDSGADVERGSRLKLDE